MYPRTTTKPKKTANTNEATRRILSDGIDGFPQETWALRDWCSASDKADTSDKGGIAGNSARGAPREVVLRNDPRRHRVRSGGECGLVHPDAGRQRRGDVRFEY